MIKGSDTLLPVVRAIMYGIKIVGFIGNKLWQILPSSLKSVPNVETFKKGVRSWKSKSRGNRICKSFIDNLGFV